MQKQNVILAIDTCVNNGYVSISRCNMRIKTQSNKIINLSNLKLQTYSSELHPHHQAETLLDIIDEVLKKDGSTYCDITHILITNGPGTFNGVRVGMSALQGICCALKLQARYKTIEARKRSSSAQSDCGHNSSGNKDKNNINFLPSPQKSTHNISVKIIPVTTMELIANSYVYKHKQKLLEEKKSFIINVVLPASKHELYLQQFTYEVETHSIVKLGEIFILKEDVIKKILSTKVLSRDKIFCGILPYSDILETYEWYFNFFTLYPDASDLVRIAIERIYNRLPHCCVYSIDNYAFSPLYVRRSEALVS